MKEEKEENAIVWWAPIVLQAFVDYGLSKLQGEPEEPGPGIPPPSNVGGFGVPQIDLSELGQIPQQVPEYGAGGSTFGQAMASFNPMRLGDVLRPQIAMGSDEFSLDRRKRRFREWQWVMG